MRAGDLVKLKNVHPEWGTVALITEILTTSAGTGQIVLLAGGTHRAIPWIGRTKYLEALNESR